MNKEQLIIKTAVSTLNIEIDTLIQLKESIDKNFVCSVKKIFASEGRIVLTGIGKSAIVAQKIVATFNSTGTPALFMHAADAIHGDLGMLRPQDILLCLSKSGETSEVKVLVPLVKNLGNRIIAMVGNKYSYLAQQADYLLHTPVSQEADPNNLAPTSSTTAQMAMGDALATSLLKLRGFSPKDFAQYHPGGSLGKQLYLRVSDIYPNNAKPIVQLSDTIRQTIIVMTSNRLGATAVVDDNGKLKGIITDGDLRRMLTEKQEVSHLCAEDIMSPNPKRIQKNELAVKAFSLMRNHSISQLIVMEGEEYVGVIHLHDLIKEGIV